MQNFKIPFTYLMCGCIDTKADSLEQAIRQARTKLNKMTIKDMHNISDYLEDSAQIDEQGAKELN